MALKDNWILYYNCNKIIQEAGPSYLENNCNVGVQRGVLQGTPTLFTGIIDKCVLLNKLNSDYINLADNNNLSFTNNTIDSPFSMSLWLNTIHANATYPIIGKGYASFFEYRVQYVGSATPANRKIEFRLGHTSGSSNYIQKEISFNTSGWQHLVFTYDGSSTVGGIKIYLNGSEVSTNPITNGTYLRMTNTTSPFRIGAGGVPPGTGFFDGLVDEIGLRSTVLTPAEVTELYNSGNGLNLFPNNNGGFFHAFNKL
jgi:hypothetical protein